MINLTSFFLFPFNDVRAAKTESFKFCEDHNSRLIKSVAEGQPFNDLLAPTQTCLDALRQSFEGGASTQAQQESKTLAVDLIISEFIKKVVHYGPAIMVHFDKNSVEYEQIYPHGRTEYLKTNKGSASKLMSQFLMGIKANMESLGEAMVTDIQDVYDRYVAARNEQLQTKESNAGLKGSWEENLTNMWHQIHINVLSIALANPGKPEVVSRYFTQSILRLKKHTKSATKSGVILLTVPKNSLTVANISYSVEDTLLLNNTGGVNLSYFGADTADSTKPDTASELQSGEEKEVTAVSLGAPTNTFLIIANETESDGEIEISLL